ncbi:MAG TPA: Eco57I restriction-modification methylase domain-containing protein [Xanthobacteraceae bacterium]|jgi:adenine-specific DNA-methyltransferase
MQPGFAARYLSLDLDGADSQASRPQQTSSDSSSAAQIARARAIAFRLTAAWWRALTNEYRDQPLREFFEKPQAYELGSSDLALADNLGHAAARLSADLGAYQIGIAYTKLLPQDYRARYGIYYTPPSLANRLIDQATEAGVDWTSARILDPASGGGAFLAPVARRIIKELHACSPRILLENIAARLRGFEIDPFGAWLSQVALDAILLPISLEAKKQLPVVVSICNTLDKISIAEFDLVIGNPPYGRTRLDSSARTAYQRSLYGHANLYGLFTDLALRYARDNGIIAFVTPTSFLAGEYFKNLRALLAQEAPPVTIDFVSVRKGVFENVLQETLLATYRRGAPAAPIKVFEVRPSLSGTLEISTVGTSRLPADPSQPWLLARESVQAPLVSRLAKLRNRLSDWGYSVSTGPLVWNRHKDQLVTRPGGKRFPLIWAEAVTSDGRFVWRAEKKNHAPYFEARNGDDWLITNCPCVLVQRTTAKEQNRRLIAAALPPQFVFRHGAVAVENHLNMVKPIGKRPPVSTEVLAKFLNSAAADRVFRCVSGSVAVSAYELEAMPLPPLDNLDDLVRLVRKGAPRDQLEAACMQIYGEHI